MLTAAGVEFAIVGWTAVPAEPDVVTDVGEPDVVIEVGEATVVAALVADGFGAIVLVGATAAAGDGVVPGVGLAGAGVMRGSPPEQPTSAAVKTKLKRSDEVLRATFLVFRGFTSFD